MLHKRPWPTGQDSSQRIQRPGFNSQQNLIFFILNSFKLIYKILIKHSIYNSSSHIFPQFVIAALSNGQILL